MLRAQKKKKVSSKFLILDNYQNYIKTPCIVNNTIHRARVIFSLLRIQGKLKLREFTLSSGQFKL